MGQENANNSFISNLAAGVPAGSVTQDTEKTLQSAGVSFNVMPSQWSNAYVNLSWNQDDYESYFFSTNRRRFEAPAQPVIFATRSQPNYSVDTYVFSLGGDLQATDELRYNGSYTFSHSKGDVAEGLGANTGPLPSVDAQINNSVHTVALGADYAFRKSMTLRTSYTYDYYKDKVFGALTGGVNTLMVGVSMGF